ncbi:uromodulin-like [Rhinophrynus dorsalis]
MMNYYSAFLLFLCYGWTFSSTTIKIDKYTIASSEEKTCVSQTETSSLTYLVDTSGSMSDDLQQLKLINGWLLDRVLARIPCGVRQYTMVEFNDPKTGPVKSTFSKKEFGDYFNNLRADGGGDCPELTIGGLHLALEASPPNSFILVLTDASAKDYKNATLLNDVYSLLSSKQSQVFFLITGLCSGINDPQFLIYREIASRSFGHVFQVSLSEMGKVFNYLDFTLSRPVNSSARLFSGEYIDGNHTDTFTVTNSFSALTVTTDGTIDSIKLAEPDDSDAETKAVVSESWGSMYLVKNPVVGIWKIYVSGRGPHSVRVEAFKVANTSSTAECSECHLNATCEENFGIKECSCRDGLIGDGFTCSDIDECAYSWSNNCSTNICINTFGSYTCVCRSGYTRSSENNCVDTDECSDSNLNACHALATCTNNIGNYSCACPPNHYGDGFYCEFDECTTGVCGQGLECIKTKGSYYCSDPCSNHTILDEPWRSTSSIAGLRCDSDKIGWYRFTGSGGVRMPEECVPDLRCNTISPMWLNGSHPLTTEGIVTLTACASWDKSCCIWSTPVQVKACPNGYYVYNLHGTPACTLAYCTDPSSITDSCSCAEDEECKLVNGSYTCYCKQRTDILGIEDLDLKLTCSTYEMKASFQACQLESLNLNKKSVHLLDSSCIGFKDRINKNLISVVAPLQDGICGTRLYTNETHAIFQNTLYVPLLEDQIIIRNSEIQMSFTCAYPLDMKLTLETSLRPALSSMSINLGGTGQFNVQMALFRDQNYLSPYKGTEVTLSTRETLYVGVILEGAESTQYVVVMRNCYATPTRNADDPLKYYFIMERCPNRQDATIRVMENGVSTRGRFSVQMFKFVGNHNQVYLHCEINLCDSSAQTCKPSCSGTRSRRSLPNDNSVVLEYGPINNSDFPEYSNASEMHAPWLLLAYFIFFWMKTFCFCDI